MAGYVVEILGRRARIVDLSRAIGPTPSEPGPPRVSYTSHEDGAQLWEHLFGIPRRHCPRGSGSRAKRRGSRRTRGPTSTHPGTTRRSRRADPAARIAETPLSRCIAPAVVLDVSDLPTGHLLTPPELEERLEGLGHNLSPGEAVLLRTGADELWGSEEFFYSGCGLGR